MMRRERGKREGRKARAENRIRVRARRGEAIDEWGMRERLSRVRFISPRD